MHRLWQVVALGSCLVWAMVSLVGGSAASHTNRFVGEPNRRLLRVLQFNLCNSGIASCYTGRSVRAAAQLIRFARPDVVTLNEICRDDVSALEPVMSDVHRGEHIASAFEAARDRRTSSAYLCRNGQPYGIGILARVPSTQGYRTFSGLYPTQDPADPEQRVWLCLRAAGDFYACTTHLASGNAMVAVAQCDYLLHSAMPALRTRGGPDPMLVGADFNLAFGGFLGARSCLTADDRRAGDGSRQYVVATHDFTVRSREVVGMRGTTDHPALLVDLTFG